MRTLRKSLCLAAASLLTASAAAGQNAPEKKWYDSVTVKGYIQFDTIFPEGKSRYGDVSNFRIRRGRPTIEAQLDPLTMAKLQVDISTGQAGSGASSAFVVDTWIQRQLPGLGYVRAGQMLLPFGREVHDDNAAIRSPLELSHAANALALAEYDIGVMLGSQVPESQPFHWEFGFYNGQGLRSADANSNKTWVGRVAAYLHPKFRMGMSGMIGTFRDTSTGGTKRNYDRHVLGVEMSAPICREAKLSGELYNARFVDSVTAPTKQVRFTGGYLMWEGWIGDWKSIPFLRYERTYGGLDYSAIDLGWRYQYAPNQRLTAEYDIVKGARNDSFGVRWQIGF